MAYPWYRPSGPRLPVKIIYKMSMPVSVDIIQFTSHIFQQHNTNQSNTNPPKLQNQTKMLFTSILAAATMALTASAAAPGKCANGGYFAGGFDHDSCFRIHCNQQLAPGGRPFQKVKGTDIRDCADKCFNDGDCINVTFNKATKQCAFFLDGSSTKYVRDPNFDRAFYSEATDGPCIGA